MQSRLGWTRKSVVLGVALAAALGNGPLVRAAEQQAEASASTTESPADKPAAPALSESERAAAVASVKGLLAAILDDDRDVREWALKQLKYILEKEEFKSLAPLVNEGKKAAALKVTPLLRKALNAPDPEEKFAAAEEIALFRTTGLEGEAVKMLLPLLRDGDKDTRAKAATALGEMGPAAKDAVPALIDALKDEDVGVRSGAAYALGKSGVEAVNAVPVLIEKLNDEDRSVRCGAAFALGKIGPAAKDAVPQLIIALKDEESMVRSYALEALGGMGSAALDAVPSLIEGLKDINDDSGVPIALGKIGHAAVPALIRLLKDEDLDVQFRAALALGNIGITAKPALMIALKDGDKSVRKQAAFSLGEIGPAALDAVPALIDALKDEDVGVRSGAAYALGRIGPVARDAIPGLISALEDDNKEAKEARVQIKAAEALGKMGPAALDAAPALIKVLKDNVRYRDEVRIAGWHSVNEQLRWAALEALGLMGYGDKEAVSMLKDALKDYDEFVRVVAVKALEHMGPKALDAVPALIEILNIYNERAGEWRYDDVRGHMAKALGGIGPSAASAEESLAELLRRQASDDAFNALVAIGATKRAEKDGALLLTSLDQELRTSIRTAISEYAFRHPIGPLPLLRALTVTIQYPEEAVANRVLAYQLSGGQPEKVALVRLAANPAGMSLAPMGEQEAKAVVAYLVTLREEVAFSPALQQRIADITARLSEKAH